MKTVKKSVLLNYSAEQMYALVIDVEKYPQFLPWCSFTRVSDASETGMLAEMGMALGKLRKSFITRNTHVPGKSVHMRLVKGPFSYLDGEWTFHPLDDTGRPACRVELQLTYDIRNPILSAVIGPAFDRIANSMVDSFIKRARQVYGASNPSPQT